VVGATGEIEASDDQAPAAAPTRGSLGEGMHTTTLPPQTRCATGAALVASPNGGGTREAAQVPPFSFGCL
jgi:hypothetical protein